MTELRLWNVKDFPRSPFLGAALKDVNPHLSYFDSRGLPCRLRLAGTCFGARDTEAGRPLPLGTSARWVLAAGQGGLLPGLGLSFRSSRVGETVHCPSLSPKAVEALGCVWDARGPGIVVRDSLHWDVLCPWLVVGVAPCEGTRPAWTGQADAGLSVLPPLASEMRGRDQGRSGPAVLVAVLAPCSSFPSTAAVGCKSGGLLPSLAEVLGRRLRLSHPLDRAAFPCQLVLLCW